MEEKQEAPQEDWMSPKEIADLLGFKTRTVYQWLREKKLKGVQFGGKSWRVRRKDLETFLEERTNK